MAKNRIKTSAELDAMREGGKMLATILQLMKNTASAGMTPKELATLAASELKKLGGEPAFLGFQGFPNVICISVNDQVQHAIPNSVPLQDGDIVNFDFGVKLRGLITDAGITIAVGGTPLTARDQELLTYTEQARDTAIDLVRAGTRVGDLSASIEAVLKAHRLGIVQELVGHGVGHELHEDPEIPNYGRAGIGPILTAGMTIAIEPIATTGSPDIYIEKDGWTIRSWDGSNCAQFEHTILVLEKGYEILTLP